MKTTFYGNNSLDKWIKEKSIKVSMPQRDIFDLWLIQEGRCAICNKELELNTCDTIIDHIIPKSKGGENNFNNYQLLCNACNTSKHSDLPCKQIKKYIKETEEARIKFKQAYNIILNMLTRNAIDPNFLNIYRNEYNDLIAEFAFFIERILDSIVFINEHLNMFKDNPLFNYVFKEHNIRQLQKQRINEEINQKEFLEELKNIGYIEQKEMSK